MITGATHALTQDLAMSIQNFRVQLEHQRNVSVNEATEPQVPASPESLEKIEAPQTPEKANIDYDALKADMDSRRDSSRQAAAHVAGLQHQQNMVDTYLNASSDNEQSSSASIGIEPADIYKASMDYSRNTALIKAFDSVASAKSDRVHVSILV
jgi:hypothetical protein